MRRKAGLFVALSAVVVLVSAAAVAEYLVPQQNVTWLKLGYYVGKVAAAPTASAGNKVTGSFGTKATVDVASVTGGTCVDTAVLLTDAGTAYMPGNTIGDPCAVGTPAAPQANVAFTCFVPSANAVTLRACAGTTADPPSGTYYFRTTSSQ